MMHVDDILSGGAVVVKERNEDRRDVYRGFREVLMDWRLGSRLGSSLIGENDEKIFNSMLEAF